MSTLEVKAIAAPAGFNLDMPAGHIVQVVKATDSTQTSIASASTYVDIGLQATITPKFSSSNILILFNVGAKLHSNDGYKLRILRGSTAEWTDGGNSGQFGGSSYIYVKTSHCHLDTNISTTSATIYKIQAVTMSGNSVDFQDNSMNSDIVLMEVAQ
jgi:hypothetical protein